MAYTPTDWKDLPDTTTPITKTRLNNMENGIKTNDDKLLGNSPMGNIVADSIRSKNMFDQTTINQGDITSTTQSVRLNSRQVLWLEVGTYTYSCSNLSATYDWGIQIQNVGIPPLSSWPTLIYETGWVSGTTTSRTFTISTAGYFTLMLRKHNDTALTPSDVSSFNFQLEKGSTSSAYSKYKNTNDDIVYTLLWPINTTNFAGNFIIKKYGKVVTLETANFTINSLSANTWTDVLNIPDNFLPNNEVRGVGFCDLLGINAVVSSGKKLVLNSRNNAVSSKGLYLNISWIIDK